MNITGFIARRYLFSKKHISLISTLTLISIAGVTVGTALLIVVLSVFNGFFDVIKGFLLQNDPDIRIESVEAHTFLYTDELQHTLSAIPELRDISAYVEGKALMVKSRDNDKVVQVKGITPDAFFSINDLQKNITSGSADLAVRDGTLGMLVSEQMMGEMNLNTGDELSMLSASGMRKSLTQFSLPRNYRFEVRGSYSQIQIVEGAAVYIDMKAAQRLFEVRNKISGIDIRLNNPASAEQIKKSLADQLGDKFKISTWYDLQRPLYDIMYLEKWSSYLILMIIVLVAVLNIIGSLTMIVIQKNRDIGVLQTMGFTPSDIKGIFMRQGLYIGLIGCVIGGGIGLLLSWLQMQYGLIKLSSAFIIDAYPVSIELMDVTIVLLGSLILCLLASWYPARRAASVAPAEAIRYD
ncbi:ABC transporter permease [Fodinibius sediminis]|uniref:Lipoprotein-releasing system permease protein n=1 Tax=Fodinibius sediminis TaxID=1214077 RepID=A0A521BFM3_9BACT|nr:ABC transporter permease [Fodinibius sediminis]SMO45520.1 lipoprotein-releasing system permease protein [Fodinibius sediminis]